MTSLALHPVLPFALAAALTPALGRNGRRLVSLLAPAVSLAFWMALPSEGRFSFELFGHAWAPLRLDALARVFSLAFIVYAGLAGIYAWAEEGAGAKAASLGLAGAGVGVVLAGDLLSLFLFWECLTVASLFLIWHGNTRSSWAAGFHYLMFHLAGATVMLIGILLLLADGGDGAFTLIQVDRPAAWLVLIGMMVNAAVPPLHPWLSDAYPRASIFGTVFLSAYTTKAAVYALSRAFPGVELLAWAGAAMALFGVTYAVLENDIRRLLAYHIISQVGYMVAGVGLGTPLALNGTTAHAFSHIFYKGLLMMSAGAVIHATGRGKLTDLGRLAGPLRWTLILMTIGALSIAGAPLFNGFVSKSMIVSASAYADRPLVELMLLVAAMGTFLSIGLKLQYFAFFGDDNGARPIRPVPRSMYAAMWLAAAVCIGTGILPGRTLYRLLPFAAEYQPFTPDHFVQALQLLLGTTLGFWIVRGKLVPKPTVTLDVDSFYRGPVVRLVYGASDLLVKGGEFVHASVEGLSQAVREELSDRRTGRRTLTLAIQTTIVFAVLGAIAGLAYLLQ